jgi:hypothetical protein
VHVIAQSCSPARAHPVAAMSEGGRGRGRGWYYKVGGAMVRCNAVGGPSLAAVCALWLRIDCHS